MRSILLIISACFLLGSTPNDYKEVKYANLNGAFGINSSPTFKGHFYLGSDKNYHYFISKWKFSSDKRFKVTKKSLKLSKTHSLGKAEIEVLLWKRENTKVEKFFELENKRTFYKKI